MNTFRFFLMTTLFLIFNTPLLAQDIGVEVTPPEPLVNESFFLTFRVRTSGSVDPYISFTPSGATVQGKTEQGVSISTTVINGKFTTNREQNYVYELIAERAGQISIRNIKVEIGGKTSTLKDITVNVLSQPRRIPDAFMEAQASKTRVYLGEGIDVNYYLYFKTSIAANDVKEFPKLNKFIKRFHHINSPVETVQYKGQVLKRILAYSARLYPEKVGAAVLDPMTISVQIVESDYSNPFGGFGLGSQRYKNKDLSSPRIEVEVLPLPTDSVPAGFTGLVGEHEFSLSVPKSKYLVNEPIELKLEVKGKGALENLEAPSIYADNNLEQFDTKSEVTELGNQNAKKVFEYTLLARGPINLKQRELPLAYFDPSSGRYIEKKIQIPGLEVSGIASSSGASPQAGIQKANTKEATTDSVTDNFLNKLFAPTASNTGKESVKNVLGLVGPDLKFEGSWTQHWPDILNAVLVAIILIYAGGWYYSAHYDLALSNGAVAEIKKEISKIKSNGFNYSDLYKVLTALDKNSRMSGGGVSIDQVVDESNMSSEAKSYFKNALMVCEEKTFGIIKQERKLVFEPKYFKEILKNI